MLGCYNGFFIAESVTVLSCVLLQFYFTLNKEASKELENLEAERDKVKASLESVEPLLLKVKKA